MDQLIISQKETDFSTFIMRKRKKGVRFKTHDVWIYALVRFPDHYQKCWIPNGQEEISKRLITMGDIPRKRIKAPHLTSHVLKTIHGRTYVSSRKSIIKGNETTLTAKHAEPDSKSKKELVSTDMLPRAVTSQHF